MHDVCSILLRGQAGLRVDAANCLYKDYYLCTSITQWEYVPWPDSENACVDMFAAWSNRFYSGHSTNRDPAGEFRVTSAFGRLVQRGLFNSMIYS